MNIFNGDSAAEAWREAFQSDSSEMLIFRDVLSCGPVQSFNGIDSWKEARQNYWQQVCLDNCVEMQSFETFSRDFYDNFEEIKSAGKCKLWVGTGLSDQLMLAFIIYLFDCFGLDFSKLSIIQFEEAKGQNGRTLPVQGLGLLYPSQVKEHPVPYSLVIDQIDRCKLAWEAFAAPVPNKYLDFMSGDENIAPLLHKAMAYVLYRYPRVDNGLTHWDKTILKNSPTEFGKASRIIGKVIGDGMDGLDFTGDWYLFSRLKNLANSKLKQPLLKVQPWDKPMRETSVKITEFGQKALENRVNVVQVNGINDWVGGVHLDSREEKNWMRDGSKLLDLPIDRQ